MEEEKDTNEVKTTKKEKKENRKGKISIGDKIFRILILGIIFFAVLLAYIFYVQGFLK